MKPLDWTPEENKMCVSAHQRRVDLKEDADEDLKEDASGVLGRSPSNHNITLAARR